MRIEVEFYGIPRLRAGTARTIVELPDPAAPIGHVLNALTRRFPDFADTCVHQGRLGRWFIANVDGQQFVDDPDTILRDGQTLLIMSADAGG